MLDQAFINYSVSHGTLRTQDLIETFVDFLKAHSTEASHQDVIAEGEHIISQNVCNDDAQWFLCEELWDAMQDMAPEGCVFGSHLGDGSDFGFWQAEEEF